MLFLVRPGSTGSVRAFRKTSVWVALSLLVGLACCTLFEGCSSIDPDPAPDSGYIEHPKKMVPWTQRAGYVQRIWFKNRKQFYATRSHFTKIYFSPTRTDFLSLPSSWDQVNSAGLEQYKDDAKMMAKCMDDTLRSVFRNDPLRRFKVVNRPDKDTIIYEFAIVELRPTKVAINVGGTVLGFFLPLAGLATTFAADTQGTIAVEVTARDGKTHELLVSWADRRIDRLALFSFRDYEKYAHARTIVQQWAEALLMDWNTPDTVWIERPYPLTLNPF